ncbi:CaiB/BaiF CoA transferase family protein [Roseiterribacter gracilis]|uniref:CoA transferase n=1 Tax=Roseiterribacter gracilis TaxID=2812848 RepID=A0A8S8XHA6_9PROT|nr:CoA transferase [Rhodospirillales bacterium TMPK1]
MHRPLAGLRIITVEQYGAGPFGSMYLADLGADVIKIENPSSGGDVSRATGPYFLGENDSLFFQTFNRNKRSLTLDLKQPDARAVFAKLVTSADAVMNNLRGDQPAKLGLDYAALAKINPKIVCGHLSGYGREGPRAAWPAYDYLMQAEAGFMEMTGDPAHEPTRFGLSIVDYMTGVTTALGLLAAVFGARNSGKGGDVDVTLFDTAVHQLTYPATWYLNEGDDVGRKSRSAHPSTVPCEIYPTKDGWVFVMAMLPKFWEAVATAVGRPELADDPRFIDAKARREHRVVLETELDPLFRAKPTEDWLRLLQGKCPIAPVLTLGQALDNPYLRDTGLIQTHAHPAMPDMEMLASPIKIDGVRINDTKPAPSMGEHTDEILGELGYDAAAIAALKKSKIV